MHSESKILSDSLSERAYATGWPLFRSSRAILALTHPRFVRSEDEPVYSCIKGIEFFLLRAGFAAGIKYGVVPRTTFFL